MSFCDLSGVLVHRMRLVVPFSGRWHADLVLVAAQDIAGPQTLNLAGTAWTCAYIRAIDFAGERGVRVVAGAGGWGQRIPDKQYGPGASITTQMVTSDAALACGEPAPVIDTSVPSTVGNAYLRQAGPAVTVLQQFLGPAWWTDTGGRVQTAPRAGTVSSAFSAIRVEGATGIYEIATEAPTDWMPGVSFSGPTVSGTVSRVTHVIDRDTFRTEVMAA